MNYAEAEGTSIDEAIERALRDLGVGRDKVDIEIISNSTRGFFGLGGRRAKVRATLRRPLAIGAEPSAAPGTPAAASKPAAAPATAAVPSGAPRTRRPEARTEGRERRSDDRNRERRPPRQAERPRRDAAPGRTPEPRPAGPPRERPQRPAAAPLDAAAIERGRTVLAEIARLIGSSASVDVAQDGETTRLVLCGDSSGTLIGRRGQTLDALEYVLNRILAHEDESIGRLVVDLEDYRLRRQRSLEAMAHRVAERARKRGKAVTLNPMSPRDRRIVHLTLQDDPTLTTRSAGSGFYRKVVIVPRDARRPPRGSDGE